MTTDSGVYQILNVIDKKVYIGSASSFTTRKWEHFNKPKCSNRYLQNAMKKYGKENFQFTVLEITEDTAERIAREQFWLDKFRAHGKELYNISPLAGSNFGSKWSEESRRKLSETRVREKIPSWSLGKTFTVEHRENISRALTGRICSEEHRKNNSLANKGRIVPKETRDKMSLARKGKPMSEDVKNKPFPTRVGMNR